MSYNPAMRKVEPGTPGSECSYAALVMLSCDAAAWDGRGIVYQSVIHFTFVMCLDWIFLGIFRGTIFSCILSGIT